MALADAIGGLLRRLGPVSLSDAERWRLGGSIFIGGPLMVRGVVRALTGRPAIFPAGAPVAVSLARHQRRAAAWLLLRTALHNALRLAQDSYLYEQSAAIKEAQAVIDEVTGEATGQAIRQAAPPTAAHDEARWLRNQRRLALAGPLLILARRKQKKRKIMLRNRRESGKSPPKPAASGAPSRTAADIARDIVTLYRRRMHGKSPGDPQDTP